MPEKENTCFVCKKKTRKKEVLINITVNLPVCEYCRGTEKEKLTEKEYLDSLAEGFVCGCI